MQGFILYIKHDEFFLAAQCGVFGTNPGATLIGSDNHFMVPSNDLIGRCDTGAIVMTSLQRDTCLQPSIQTQPCRYLKLCTMLLCVYVCCIAIDWIFTELCVHELT